MPSKKSSAAEVRVRPIRVLQKRLDWDPVGLLAGVDEAGRGPLAGPVVAAAVILDDARRVNGLADSKVLTPLQRDKLYDRIREKALCCSVGSATVEEIDSLNIFHATMLAMKRAVEGLRLKPAKVLVDGNRLPKLDILSEAIVGGDAKVKSISAASIIAKVTRDRLLQELHEQFPQYGFAAHKGYSTPEHLEALRVHGPCVHHRKHFAPVAAQFALADGAMLSVQVQ
ncbi:MAG TPA: ribonuclease HII [Ramlibacter sp.]|nr:ribonuclease HII [Ramlibacter sp.]